MVIPFYDLAVALIVLWILFQVLNMAKREENLPPGPPTVPILGNLHIFPTQFPQYKLTEWAREYGPIYSLKRGRGTTIVLSSATTVKELMDKRSSSTADRPSNYMVDQITGGLNMGLAHYMGTWRTLRKAAHSLLSPQASNNHLPIQKAEAAQLMYDILRDPEGFYTHIFRYSHSTIMSLLYGIRFPPDTKVSVAVSSMFKQWSLVLRPGAHPSIDFLPVLKYLPERWAPWKRACKEVVYQQRKIYFGLLDACESRMQRGEGNGCYIEEILERQEVLGLDRDHVGYLGGTLIEGGIESTSSFLRSLVLAMVAFPEAQRKAHEEIDRVVGIHRVPSLEDFEHLTYIQALIKEAHRFRPALPMGLPHATLEYKGYVIPRGATILVNVWAIFHDPDAFDNPEVFDPDRYLLTEHGTKLGFDATDFRADLIFGSGRRFCPGINLASNSLILNTMNLLWGFDFNLVIDPLTKDPIPIDLFNYNDGLTSVPRPFKCAIIPRGQVKADLIKQEFYDASSTFSKFKDGLEGTHDEWLKQTGNIPSGVGSS
ncbi:cytochrome P450 [Mycena crocata]|nr:cytochrome P450 [Mycena crocata]